MRRGGSEGRNPGSPTHHQLNMGKLGSISQGPCISRTRKIPAHRQQDSRKTQLFRQTGATEPGLGPRGQALLHAEPSKLIPGFPQRFRAWIWGRFNSSQVSPRGVEVGFGVSGSAAQRHFPHFSSASGFGFRPATRLRFRFGFGRL